ncbi:hypothetical protein [Nostoc sp.]|uniref:hypothetical protein n=1 Tax=Nostoc sp. TaxID=1180 RepID=UPI002FFB5754
MRLKKELSKHLSYWGFALIREREHIVIARENEDGSQTPLVMPNQSQIKSGTISTVL